MTIEHARNFAKHFGITVSSEDVPKLVTAIQNAYATGKKDEREACAALADAMNTFCMPPDVGAAIRARGTP